MSDTFDTGEFYFPGGAGATAANFYLAARGDCALVGAALPAGCTLQSGLGSIAEGSPTNPVPEAGNDTARPVTTINENAAARWVHMPPDRRSQDHRRFSVWLQRRLLHPHRSAAGAELRNPRQLHAAALGHARRAVEIHENRDNVETVDNLEHDRNYSFTAMLVPNPAAGRRFRLQLLERLHAVGHLLQLFDHRTRIRRRLPPL